MHSSQTTTPAPLVFMIDDNPHDIELTRMALVENGFRHRFGSVENGEDAVRYLSDVMAGEAERPALIVIDLNMPRITGHEILAFIKEREGIRAIPTVILTTSDSAKEQAACFLHGACAYIVKSHQLETFLGSFCILDRYLGPRDPVGGMTT